jgi:imidazolonepropionase-like amidohydrolase
MTAIIRSIVFAGLALLGLAASASAQQATETTVLFQNVRVFDGKASALSPPSNVVVRGNKIERIATSPIAVDRGANTTIVNGNGRTLMPGLIDAHAHIMIYNLPNLLLVTGHPDFLQIRAAASAKYILMDGFTSVRDMGGPSFGLKQAIDEGLVEGPRIFPSGAMISQTSGHGEYRSLNQIPGSLIHDPPPGVRFGHQAMADGVPAVLTAVREQLMQGASQIKLAAGGGVMSSYDPIDVSEFTVEELKAAVDAAEDWGTYVAVHVYTSRSVRKALEAGVKSIEHGQLLHEPTIKLIAEKGAWLSTQPFLDDEDRIPTPPGSEGERKYKQVAEGTSRAYTLAKKYGVKTAFGTDMLQTAGAREADPVLPAEAGRMVQAG